MEGSVTETSYFEAIRVSRRLSTGIIQVEPPGPTSPLEIVKRAHELQVANEKKDPFDEVWCVFDVEAKVTQSARTGLDKALNLAGNKGIKIALSNPCFELWLLLHHEDHTAYITSDAVQRKCSELNLVKEKRIQNMDVILSRHNQAKTRAEALVNQHDRDGTNAPADRNPETNVHRLVDAIYVAFP